MGYVSYLPIIHFVKALFYQPSSDQLIPLCILNNLDKNTHIHEWNKPNNCFNLSVDPNLQAYLGSVQQYRLTASIPTYNKTAETIVGGLAEKVLDRFFHFLLSRGEGWGVNQLATSQLRYKHRAVNSSAQGGD